MRWFYRLFVISLWCALFCVCGCQKKASAPVTEAGPESIPVKVMTVKPGDMQEFIDYVANVKAQEEAMAFPRVTGKIVEKVRQEGDQVAKGDTIALIDRDEVGQTFEKASVESPLAGLVGSVMVDLGSYVTPQTPVALVVDMTRVKVALDVPEKYLPLISVGMAADVSVEAYPQEIFKGSIERISPIVDTATRTSPVEIGIDNKEMKLRSGMYAKVKVVTREFKDTVAVFKEAVLGKAPQQYVYLAKDGKARLQDVVTGIRQGQFLQIVQGLSQGDKVVIMGQQRLYDGAPVTAQENGS